MVNQGGKDRPASQLFKKKLCPFVRKAYEECHCSDTGSDSAEAAIRLCGGDFEKCEVYRKKEGSANETRTLRSRQRSDEIIRKR